MTESNSPTGSSIHTEGGVAVGGDVNSDLFVAANLTIAVETQILILDGNRVEVPALTDFIAYLANVRAGVSSLGRRTGRRAGGGGANGSTSSRRARCPCAWPNIARSRRTAMRPRWACSTAVQEAARTIILGEPGERQDRGAGAAGVGDGDRLAAAGAATTRMRR